MPKSVFFTIFSLSHHLYYIIVVSWFGQTKRQTCHMTLMIKLMGVYRHIVIFTSIAILTNLVTIYIHIYIMHVHVSTENSLSVCWSISSFTDKSLLIWNPLNVRYFWQELAKSKMTITSQIPNCIQTVYFKNISHLWTQRRSAQAKAVSVIQHKLITVSHKRQLLNTSFPSQNPSVWVCN